MAAIKGEHAVAAIGQNRSPSKLARAREVDIRIIEIANGIITTRRRVLLVDQT